MFKKCELDHIFAVMGLIFSSFLIVYLIIFTQKMSYRYIEAPFMAFIGCLSYILIIRRLDNKKKLNDKELLLKNVQYDVNHRTVILTISNISFFILLSFSIFSVMTRADIYSRSLGYFLSISLIVAILAIEILLVPNKKYAFLILLKIILVALVLRWIPQQIFPSLLGTDPWWHQMFTMKILESGYIPDGYSYSKLPVMHLVISSTSVITGLGYKLSSMMSVGFFQISSLILIFLLGSFIYDNKTGLFAALLLSVADTFIELGYNIRPITLGTSLILFPIYLIIINSKKTDIRYTFLILTMSFILIMTHTIAALIANIILFSFWLGSKLYKNYKKEKFKDTVNSTFPIWFMIAMLVWWMYASGNITHLGKLISWGFKTDLGTVSNMSDAYVNDNIIEYMLSILGFNSYLGISFIGLLFISSKRFTGIYEFLLLIGTLPILLIIFTSLFINMLQLLPMRWYPSLQIMLSIPLAVSIILIYKVYKYVGFLIIFIMIFLISFFSTISPIANIDYRIYPNTILRSAYTESELSGMDFITDKWDKKIASDRFTEYYFRYNKDKEYEDLVPALLSKDFDNMIGKMIILRKEILNNPFNDYRTLRLTYNPIIMLNKKFNKIFDNDAINIYY